MLLQVTVICVVLAGLVVVIGGWMRDEWRGEGR